MREINNGIFETDNSDEIYAIGDIHGDYQCFIHCLVDLCNTCYISGYEKYNGEYKEIITWNDNNKSIIIFCGDLIDRKRFDHVLDDECSDIFIIETILKLKSQAISNGGNVLIISGNHEMMNIINPEITNYISDKNRKLNFEKMTNIDFVNNYIQNSYAWLCIDDILICHGGLCSDYLKYVNGASHDVKGKNIIKYINDAYRSFFHNYDYKIKNVSNEYYSLFIEQKEENKQNIFWCRMWGYNKHTLELFTNTLKTVGCKKMIVAHCPQFLNKTEPKMINFEYNTNNGFNLARIDLGMSRSFDYNKPDKFLYYLDYNFNRKMSVLKLHNHNSIISFDMESIITKKLSCIQYVLLKYGITKESWKENNIHSNWLGFEKIKDLSIQCNNGVESYDKNDEQNIMKCLLYPVFCSNYKNLKSIQEYKNIKN